MNSKEIEKFREDSSYAKRIFDQLVKIIPLTKKPYDITRLSFSKMLNEISSMDYVFDWSRNEMATLPSSNGIVEKVIVTEQGFCFIATSITVRSMVPVGGIASTDMPKIKVYDNINGFSLFNEPLILNMLGIPENSGVYQHMGISDPYEIPEYYFGERGQIAVNVSKITQAVGSKIGLTVIVSGVKISTTFFKDL